MASPTQGSTWEKLVRLRRQRRIQNWMTLGLVILGPCLALITFLLLGPLDQAASAKGLRVVILADLVYILVVAAMVFIRVARMIAARRARSAGSRLHLRLTGVFTALALVPTILVAVFAVITVNLGLEGWFSDRVGNVVENSLLAAQAYEDEHRRGLKMDAEVLANYLADRRGSILINEGELRQLLTKGQAQIQRGLKEAFIIDSSARIRVRGERSYLFDFERPSQAHLESAALGSTVIIEDWDINEFRALVPIPDYTDLFLYVSREVDGEILSLLDETKETVLLYQQLENERGELLFDFGLLYLGFAVILILAAIWLGMWFAERLSLPVGRLAGAAQRVGAGDLDAKVPEEQSDDEIAMLGRVFNQMTQQLKGQRAALIEGHRDTEIRRRQFDSVLTSVTAGVMGLDADGRIDFVNRSACRLLGLNEQADHGRPVARAVPEFADLFQRLRDGAQNVEQEEVRVTRDGKLESLLVRMSLRHNSDDELEGYVVAFDDVTDLVSAQRMAAWGDVARRIAHEIKNPLTPIQLSAERLRRKFRPLVGDQAENLEQMTDVIVRQTGDLRRIVDEFSKFARMPEPERREENLVALLRDAVLLQEAAQSGTLMKVDIPDQAMMADLDRTMISQALTNLIKNAGEAIESLVEKGAPDNYRPELRITMTQEGQSAIIKIMDNGVGLPEDRSRLFEPYVTTRDKGTGLGLSIVKKIIEEHGGALSLTDAPSFEPGTHKGAMAEIRLPLVVSETAVLAKKAV